MASSAANPRSAPELRVPHWIDGQGQPRPPLTLADLGSGHKIIYCFQHWCEGCHASGFPALQRLVGSLASRGFGFAVVQTVFEGAEVNTPERLRETQLRYELQIPFGHDASTAGYPTVMLDYQTGGTPWFIVIEPSGQIIHSNFHIDVDRVIALAERSGADPPAPEPAPRLRWSTVVEWAQRGNPVPPRRVVKSDSDWRLLLSAAQYNITRLKGTERPFSSGMCELFEPGRYLCVCCETPLFDSGSKFDSGTGWPSFDQPVTPDVVAYHLDTSHGMTRVETTCNVCDAHLGHVFPDGPAPTGLRYCINSLSLKKAKG